MYTHLFTCAHRFSPVPFTEQVFGRRLHLGGHLTEIGLAGIVALHLQKSIDWDGPNMKVPGMPEADKFIRKTERAKFGRA